MTEPAERYDEVLIVGGGISGPAMALALQRAGIRSRVFEASPAPRDDAGAFLNIAPNGLSVLRQLELDQRAAHLGFRNDRLIFENENGKTLADIQIGGVTLMRGSLCRLLREAAQFAGIRFEFGKRFDTVHDYGSRVQVRFSDGSSVIGPILIAADGIHSRVRKSFFPEAPPPSYTGIITLGGMVKTSLPSTGSAMRMIFGHEGFFGYAVLPTGDTYWFSHFMQAEEPTRGTFDRVDASVFRDRLLEIHRRDPPAVTQILESIEGEIGAYPIYDIPSIPRWHRAHVCLIGDAAHAIGPHAGQGTSLALEDAFVLAKCLRDLSGSASAFEVYERMRRQRVERVAEQARRTSQQKVPGGVLARKVRDLVLPVVLKKDAQAAEWLYSYPVDWSERVTRR
jgi:FAD-dependent urate hydroxylase